MPNKMACCRDKELAEIVLPVLHGKSRSYFHRKDRKSNYGKKSQMTLSLRMVSAEKLNLFVPEAAVEMCF